ncbi:RNase adapter RapZ [Oceaniglobus trochenteri]|uniref:RNase adapter RapZ n=1 Tax=Oceaniglobus trochenteri TaxID=2763260 RepID=UPI001CFFF2FC|nr:RNase adapter RapZ [Oceaniglobus trochenteri]
MTDSRSPIPPDGPARIVLITGPSGAGRSTAINALEDMGFEAIDNLPLSLLPRLLDGAPPSRPLALGLDARNRDFSTSGLIEVIDRIAATPGLRADVLFLDASAEVLQRRYSETRRRHPLAPAETPEVGIAREADLLAPIRARSDIVIDTSELSPHDLRAELAMWFDGASGSGLAVSVQSFSYKRGLPRGVDMVFDVRFLRNPYWEPELRPLNGTDPAVAAYVAGDPLYGEVFARVRDLLLTLLPAYREEGKTHLAIGFGCTGGQHRSVAVAEHMAKALAEADWQVSTRHREMERRAALTTGTRQV